ADAFLGIGDPAVDDEVDRAVAVAVEPNGRRRGLEHPRHALGRLDHQRLGLLDVAAVGYAHGNLDAHVAARVGPFSTWLIISCSLGIRYSRWSRVVTETARMPILRIWPKVELPAWSVTAITSPGLIERSISRMIPASRLPKVFCRPKPSARPSAPENTASAVRSIPRMSIVSRKVSVQIATEISFCARICCAGPIRWTRRIVQQANRIASRANSSAPMTT